MPGIVVHMRADRKSIDMVVMVHFSHREDVDKAKRLCDRSLTYSDGSLYLGVFPGHGFIGHVLLLELA